MLILVTISSQPVLANHPSFYPSYPGQKSYSIHALPTRTFLGSLVSTLLILPANNSITVKRN